MGVSCKRDEFCLSVNACLLNSSQFGSPISQGNCYRYIWDAKQENQDPIVAVITTQPTVVVYSYLTLSGRQIFVGATYIHRETKLKFLLSPSYLGEKSRKLTTYSLIVVVIVSLFWSFVVD